MKKIILLVCFMICLTAIYPVYADEVITWKSVESGTESFISKIAWGNNKFVAVGDGCILISRYNGENWEKVYENDNYQFWCVAWGKDKFIAIASDKATDTNKVFVSYNGVVWEEQNVNLYPLITDIIWANNQFVGVGASKGHGAVVTSKDGKQWAENVLKDTFILNAVTWGNNEFIAVGSTNKIYASKDGMKWEMRKIPQQYGSSCEIAWSKNGYIIIGDNVITSKDGKKWVVKNSIEPDINNIVWADNKYIAVFHNMVIGKKAIMSTVDGNKWSELLNLTDDGIAFNDLVYANNRYIIVGDNGIIYLGRTKNVIDEDKRIFSFLINDKDIEFTKDKPIINQNGIITFPLDNISSQLGLKTEQYAPDAIKLTLKTGESILLKNGDAQITISGTTKMLDIPISIINNKIQVSTNFIEALGIKAQIDKTNKLIIIKTE